MSQFKDAPIFDADQHMYETPDALTRYLPKEFQPKCNSFRSAGTLASRS